MGSINLLRARIAAETSKKINKAPSTSAAGGAGMEDPLEMPGSSRKRKRRGQCRDWGDGEKARGMGEAVSRSVAAKQNAEFVDSAARPLPVSSPGVRPAR